MSRLMQSVVLERCPHCGTGSVSCQTWGECPVPGPQQSLQPRDVWKPACCGKCYNWIFLRFHTDNSGVSIVEQYPALSAKLPDELLIPAKVRDEYAEAAKCLGIGCFLASMTMSRRVLQRILSDKGYKQGKLYEQIDAAFNAGDLTRKVKPLADEIRQYGNIEAHPDDDKDLAVTREAAEHLLKFVDILIHDLYELPATVDKMTAARKK